MAESHALSVEQQSLMRAELSREDLSIYGAVRLARDDVSVGNFDAAMARLRIDSDKIRMVSPLLIELMHWQEQI